MDHYQQKRVVMLASVNFLISYAGFQYLADSLYERGFEIEIFAHIPRDMMSETRKLPYRVHSCYESFFGRIPRLRHWIFIRKVRRALHKNCDAVIIVSYAPDSYFREGIEFKRRYPEKPLIQYCPELWLTIEQGRFRKKQCEFYLHHANTPDMIIDVEPYRAKLRTEHFDLKKPVHIIPNTLPAKAMLKPASHVALEKITGVSLQKDQRILFFTGLVSPMTLAELQAIMSVVSDRVFFLWFAHGSDQAITEARKTFHSALGAHRVHVSCAVPRTMLLSILHQADAGLIAYSYRACSTMNQKYAAPTKLYEYLAAGLPIVSYGNPSIKKLVDEFNLGNCAKEDTPESLGQAINELFARPDFPSLREHVKEVFAERLCYEKCAENVLNQMCDLIYTRREGVSS